MREVVFVLFKDASYSNTDQTVRTGDIFNGHILLGGRPAGARLRVVWKVQRNVCTGLPDETLWRELTADITMAEQLKELRKRIRSVGSTKQITRTMELVATSKMKRAQERMDSAKPYNAKLRDLLTEVAGAGAGLNEPFLTERTNVKRVGLIMICANRGLCGGYNANVIRMAKNFVADHKEQGRETVFDVVGKKGVGTLKYQGYSLNRTVTTLTDRPTLEDARQLVDPMKEAFVNGEVDEVHVIWTQWRSMATQKPTTMRLLPIGKPEGSSSKGDMIFSPEPQELLASLLPMYLSHTIYTCLVEAIAGEQVARRTAMKSATDNANQMITSLTRRLNRARQAQITQEIAEIVGGAAALD